MPKLAEDILCETQLVWYKSKRKIVASVEFMVLAAYIIVRLVQILWIFQQVLPLPYSPVIVWSRFGSCNFSRCKRASSSADRRKQFHQQQCRRRWQCRVWRSLSNLTSSTLVRCSPALQQLILNRWAFNSAN